MAAEERVKKMISYWETLASDRTHWENTWQEVSDHSLARREFTYRRNPGRQRTIRIYDSTSQDANNLLAAAMHSLLTNPATHWFDLRFSREDINQLDEAQVHLEAEKQWLRAAFNRPGAGFATQSAQVYQDLPGWGTGIMYIDEVSGFGSRFSARPLYETYIDVDQAGRVKAIFRRFELKAWQAVDHFGDEVGEKILKANEKEPSTPFLFIHHVRERGKPMPGAIDSRGMAWESIYISLSDKRVVREGGFRSNPFQVARWEVDTGEMYGRCPGIDALPEQKMLNAIWRSYIRAVEKAADPPILVDHESVVAGSQLRISPNAQIVVNNDGATREPIRYLESRARLEIAADLIDSRTKKIEKHYHNEVIEAFKDPRMTATQVLELARLSQRILSPLSGRMQEEFLEPMIQRVRAIESRRPGYPQLPDFLAGQELKIEYISPVVRAQKASESQAILDSFAAAAAMAEAEPSVLDNIDLDAAVRAIFEGNGTPIQVLRPRAEVIEIRQAEAQLAERERQAQTATAEGETISKLLPGIAKLQEVAA